MAYNPNPPFNPSDYGNRTSGIDYAALQQSLDETRKAIAELGSDPIVSDAKANVATLLERQPTERLYDTPIKDRDVDSYRKSDWTVSQRIQDQMDKNIEFVNMFRQSVQGVPEKYLEEPEPGKDKGKGKDKDKGKDKGKDGLKLPELGDQEAYSFGLYNEGSSAPGFKKNPSFDGRDFEYFLERAKKMEPGETSGESGRPDYANPVPSDAGKNALYNTLKDAGLSEEEMFKGAQYAGLTNVNSQSDIDQILEAVNNNYYADAGKSLKAEKDLFKEFKELGGKGNLQEFKDAQKYQSYDTKKDAKQFANYLSDQLAEQGIYQSGGLGKAQDKFGKKFSMSDYNAALDYKNQDAKYISNYLKDYLERGGKVGERVQALIDPNQTPQIMGPLTPLQSQFQSMFPTDAVQMGPVQYPNLFK